MAKLPGAVAGARIVGEKFVHSRRSENPDGRMPLMDHLRELRNRVVKIAIAVLACSVVGYVFFKRIWNFMQQPYCHAVGHCTHNGFGQTLILSGITDGFYLRLKIAIVVGVIIASPVWLYQLWAFVAPGLYSRERRWTYMFLGTAVPLFALGVFFAIQAMSRAMQFFISITGGTSLSMNFTADTYLSFWVMMILGFGVIFEVPLFLAMLNLARIVTHERFKKWRRVIIFLVFVFAGIASPSPDPLTMLLLGGVVVVLVEAAEVFIFLNDRRYARNHPDPYAGLGDNELAPLEDIGSSDMDSSDTVSLRSL